MLIRKPADIPSSEITPKADYLNRRQLMAGIAAAGAAGLAGERIARMAAPGYAYAATKLQTVKSPLSTTGETPTSLQDITHYNNFYEFGTDKSDPARNAGAMRTRPWSVQVSGLVKKKQTLDIDALLKLRPMEERVYRFRCVEGWSMVIPWAGYSLSELIKQCDPLPSAKYVQFISLADPKQMPQLEQV
ncbi:MAG: methionine sulfoxide reductase catalytic subunit, partial [Acidobacteriaceae bacterium]|nr:methionine sulfoxide reductase catalytic subunit [Acidobacteriaceae bacterium]